MTDREQLVREAEDLANTIRSHLAMSAPHIKVRRSHGMLDEAEIKIRRLLSLLPKEGEVVVPNIEVVSDRLCLAWSMYKRNFGEPPHGTAVQFRALIQLAGGVEKLLSTKP